MEHFCETERLLLHQKPLDDKNVNFEKELHAIWRKWPQNDASRERMCKRQIKQKTSWIFFHTPSIKDYYQMGHVIGTPGQYGTVREAICYETGEKCAVKLINKLVYPQEHIRKILYEDLRYEVFIMHKSREHENIVTIHEVFEDAEHLYVVMEELNGGELYDYLQQNRPLSEGHVCEIFMQMLNSIFYLHSLNVVHCDLKPENFVFAGADHTTLKLIDFGMSKIVIWKKYFSRMNGTPYYVAPEVLEGHYNEESDIWSLGVCLYTMVYGVPPFFSRKKQRNLATKDVYALIRKGFQPVIKEGYGPWFPSNIKVSSYLRDLISRLLRQNVADRITAAEALNHSWLKNSCTKPISLINPVIIQSIVGFHGGSKLLHEIIHVLQKIGFLNPHQESIVAEEFSKMDKNNDGLVDFDEFCNVMMTLDPSIDRHSCRTIFKIIDHDHHGAIASEEILSARIYKKITCKIDRLEKLFGIMDTDRDGFVSVMDLQSVLETCSVAEKHEQSHYAMLLAEVDQNHDGQLSFDDFLNMFGVTESRQSPVIILNE